MIMTCKPVMIPNPVLAGMEMVRGQTLKIIDLINYFSL